ncbi:hypothetical protein SAMN05880590_10424 [Rhizobium sp. RU35A]|nr:hypothetical protein SAMN05880590_10424 [Rhizobium sp. RU35A]
MRVRVAIAVAMLLGGSVGARAEVGDIWVWSTLVPSIARTDTLGLLLQDRLNQEAEARNRAGGSQPGAGTPNADDGNLQPVREVTPADLAALRYTPSPARRSANLARFIERTRAADPAGAADLQRLFADGDIISRIDALIRPQGLRIDNLADAYTLWLLTVWQAAHGRNDTPESATLLAVRAQMALALRDAGGMTRASSADKQELAEALLVQAMLIDGAVEQAKGTPTRLEQVRAAARKNAGSLGIDVDRFDLTPQGFAAADQARR